MNQESVLEGYRLGDVHPTLGEGIQTRIRGSAPFSALAWARGHFERAERIEPDALVLAEHALPGIMGVDLRVKRAPNLAARYSGGMTRDDAVAVEAIMSADTLALAERQHARDQQYRHLIKT